MLHDPQLETPKDSLEKPLLLGNIYDGWTRWGENTTHTQHAIAPKTQESSMKIASSVYGIFFSHLLARSLSSFECVFVSLPSLHRIYAYIYFYFLLSVSVFFASLFLVMYRIHTVPCSACVRIWASRNKRVLKVRQKEREVNASGGATVVERVFVRMHNRHIP